MVLFETKERDKGYLVCMQMLTRQMCVDSTTTIFPFHILINWSLQPFLLEDAKLNILLLNVTFIDWWPISQLRTNNPSWQVKKMKDEILVLISD